MKKSKIAAGVLTLLFMLTSVCFMQPKGSEVMASNSGTAFHVVKSQDISAYKRVNEDGSITSTIPKAGGDYADWIFAGWYKDEACTLAVGKKTVEGKYHAKFVPAEVLSVKCQTSNDIAPTDKSAKIRVISTVDSVKYSQVGFDLTFKGKEISYKTATVLTAIQAATDGVEYGFSPNIFDLQSKYFITATIVNIQNEDFDEGLLVKPYWITKDGTKVHGVERYARVEDSYNHIVNVPIRLVSNDVKATEGTVTVTYDNDNLIYQQNYTGTIANEVTTTTPGCVAGGAFTVIAEDTTTEGATKGTVTVTASATNTVSTDGMFAHLRFQLKNNEVVLPKRNEFKVASSFTGAAEVQAVDSVYHYYHTTYTGKADTDWFEGEHVKEGTTEFVITSPDELYGLAELVDAGRFTTQKVYLSADIKVNKQPIVSTAEDGSTTITKTYDWTPIGTYTAHSQNADDFQGKFDGQGHIISGLYTDISANASLAGMGAGLFGTLGGNSEVKNVRIENSYFKASNYAGGVVGRLKEGAISNVYSDADVAINTGASQIAAGGLAGACAGTIDSCWFAGTVNGDRAVGGVAGFTSGNATITNCLSDGIVCAYDQQAGGLVGQVNGTTKIEQCLSRSTITITQGIGRNAGTIYGWHNSGTDNSTGTLELNSVYGYTATANVATGTGKNVSKGSATTISDISAIHGYKALDGDYDLDSKFDFTNIWVARATDTPVLKAWVEEGALYTPSTAWDGEGTEKNPWIIKTAGELYGLSKSVNEGNTYAGKHFALGANITVNSGTVSAWDNNAPTYNWIPIGANTENNTKYNFQGTFDGQGYSIKGLYFCDKSATYSSWRVGLFGSTQNATIRDVRILNSTIQGGAFVGAFAGHAENTNFVDLYTDAIVKAIHSQDHAGEAGGIVGKLTTGKIDNCWNAGDVTSGTYGHLGGILGVASGTEIVMSNCLNTGDVTGSGIRIGGFLGCIAESSNCIVKLSESLNLGNVSRTDLDRNVGSAVGQLPGNTHLWVDQPSVRTVSSNLTYTIGTGFAGYVYNISGGDQQQTNNYILTVDANAIQGAAGYTETKLTFDRPETKDKVEGAWATTKTHPILVSFADVLGSEAETVNTQIAGVFRADTKWFDNVKVETQEDGSTIDTYTLNTPEDLYGFAKLVNTGNTFANKKVYLGEDIVLHTSNAKSWSATETMQQWTPIGANPVNNTTYHFRGTFDGQGHSISGVYFSDTSKGYTGWRVGLFGSLKNATITNVRLLNSMVQGGGYVGAFAGYAENTNFTNLYSETDVNAYYSDGYAGEAGGIVGLLQNGEINNCWNAGSVASGKYGRTGGIVGSVYNNVVMSSCLNTGDVSSTKDFGGSTNEVCYYVGGFAGYMANGCVLKLSDSLNMGSVSSAADAKSVGAAVGTVRTGTTLYVEKESVHTILAGSVASTGDTIGSQFSGGVYNFAGVIQTNDHTSNILSVEANNINGVNGYTNTGLAFDRPETTDVVEGTWITTSSHPILGTFIDLFEEDEYAWNKEMQGQFRADTAWATVVTDETLKNEFTNNEYIIDRPEELYGFAKLVNTGNTFAGKEVFLGSDIVIHTGDAKSWNETETLQQWTPIGANPANNTTYNFQGTFDGQGHSISGLYFADTTYDYTGWRIGLFGSVNGATIENVKLLNSSIQGGGYVGSFVGYATNAQFTNLYSNATLKAIYSNGHAGEVGGIVGLLQGGTLSDCTNDGNVMAGRYGRAGGILGVASTNAVVLSNCLNTGSVTSVKAYGSNQSDICICVGGLLGRLEKNATKLTISNSWNDGDITAGVDTTSGKYVGGLVGFVGSTETVIEYSLNSGNIHFGDQQVGGLIGTINNGKTTTITECLNVGNITTDHPQGVNNQNAGSVIGYQLDGAVNATNVFGYAGNGIGFSGGQNSTYVGDGNDTPIQATNISYIDGVYDISLAGELSTEHWLFRVNNYPIPVVFMAETDDRDYRGVDSLLKLDYWNSDEATYTNAEDKGTGNFMLTIDNAVFESEDETVKTYKGYLNALQTNGFTAYANDNGLNEEGVHNAIYTMGTDWVVNVTYIEYKENNDETPKIYITFNTGQPLSKHLKAADVASVDYSATDGYSVAQDKVTYHMLESSYAGFGAGSYVMQIKNGHFVVIDGGILDDVDYLFEYLETLAVDENGNQLKPIVEAWVFSHSHSDHMGPMLGIMNNVDTYKDRIYVEGFYYNEPNGDIVEAYGKGSEQLTKALKTCAAQVLKTTEGKSPQIYRIQTGQRYTFDDVTMDIMLSQELLSVADYEATLDTNNSYQQDSFNDTSTWCMFTIGEGDDAQKLFSAGDGSYSGKKYVCDMYSSGYLTVDVFTALHHGLNTNMSNYLKADSILLDSGLQEAFTQKCTVEGVVLYSYKFDMTKEETTNRLPNTAFAVNRIYARLNSSFIDYLEGKSTTFANGIPVKYLNTDGSTKSESSKKYLYFGEGASVLTFHGKTATNPITAEVLPNYDFTK